MNVDLKKVELLIRYFLFFSEILLRTLVAAPLKLFPWFKISHNFFEHLKMSLGLLEDFDFLP